MKKVQAEYLKVTAGAKLPSGDPYTWTISLPIGKAKNRRAELCAEINKLLDDFPDLVQTYLKSKETNLENKTK